VEVAASFFELDGQKLVLAAMRDISERLLAEEALRETRRFLSDLIENSGGLVFVKDCEGRYILINHKWEEVTGLRRQDVLGRTDEELFPGSVGRQFRKNDLDVFASGQVKELEEVLESVKGNRFFLSIKFPLRNENGSITGICGMNTEITERRQAEEERERLRGQLSQAHKMESIGRLAGDIAHDFNNMLGVILGHTELALLAGTSPEQVQSDLKEIEKAARRSADLTRQMLAFARKQTVMPHTLDLNETVTGMLNMLRWLIGEDIELVWSPGEGLWPVKMDPSQIDQILANLCVNARDAIKDGGRVVIRTENAIIRPSPYEKSEGCVAGDFAMLMMMDNGCGMDQETKSLLFEPFFTTKAVSKGTGLGLATVYGIVQQNKGFIEVESQPERGTTFKVYLPRDGDQVSSLAGGEVSDTLMSGKETVLLVEDEPANLAMARQMLEKIGYRVLTAGMPLDAIRLAQEHTGKIDLLMTDVIMPGMNGWELAKKMQEIRPGIKLLFTSGYTSTTIAHNSVIEEGIHFIQKPFTLQDLSTQLRKALEQQTEDV
jgi:two-component system, cell cycle sensor histidine kinase and response regulator CckA